MREGYEYFMIEMEHISAGYGKREILHGVDLRISRGEIVTLIGANGSGKSSLLRALVGFLPLWSGDIRIGGISVKGQSRAERAQKTAYLSQGKNVPEITVERMVLHGRFPYLQYPRKYKETDYQIAGEAMEQMGISGLAGKRMKELSGGMRQKVYIAMALAQQADIIVMDEPTTYLDLGQQLKFVGMMRQLSDSGKTILLVLHDILLALQISHRMAVLEDGRILLCGTPEEILRSDIIGRLYGVSVKTHSTDTGTHYFYERPENISQMGIDNIGLL